jgi:hypothetical protein
MFLEELILPANYKQSFLLDFTEKNQSLFITVVLKHAENNKN